MSKFIPDALTVPAPRRSTMPRGIHATRKQAPNISIRFPTDELSDIDKAAELCEMTRAEFIRWVSHYAALEVFNQEKFHGYK